MTPADQRLAVNIRRDTLTVDAVLQWLAMVQDSTFAPKDSCNCPVARYLTNYYNAPAQAIEVGDDDISVNGYHVEPIPTDVRAFVNWFDTFDASHEWTGAEILETWIRSGRGAKQ